MRSSEDAIRSSEDDIRSSEDVIRSSEDAIQSSEDNIRISEDVIRSSEDDIRSSKGDIRSSKDAIRISKDAIRSSEDPVRPPRTRRGWRERRSRSGSFPLTFRVGCPDPERWNDGKGRRGNEGKEISPPTQNRAQQISLRAAPAAIPAVNERMNEEFSLSLRNLS